MRDNIQTDVENLTGGNGVDTSRQHRREHVRRRQGGGPRQRRRRNRVDTITYVKRTTAVSVDLIAGIGGNADDGVGGTLTAIKNVTGGTAGDILLGTDQVNRIEGKAGVDTVDARNGNDTVLIDDGIADGSVNCGGGTDRIRADPRRHDRRAARRPSERRVRGAPVAPPERVAALVAGEAAGAFGRYRPAS